MPPSFLSMALYCWWSRTAGAVSRHEEADMEDPSSDVLGLLIAHTEAWNSHDLDRLMDLFDHDCVFLAAGGEEACGTTYAGTAAVRAAFAEIYGNVADAEWCDGRHTILDARRGVSEWRMVGTLGSGDLLDINGCDFLTFDDGKILAKDSYTKDRPAISAG
jgi:ketosteroid isomerase-like protein